MHSGLTLRSEFESRRLSPVEVTRELLGLIESSQPSLNAFVTVTADLALQQAAAAERAYADGQAGPLAGVPVSIKDLVELRGVRCTLGSLVDPERVSSADDPLA
ncbi:MAG: amidase family protein, partial [Gaiellales bacterium]